jgi:hypothetical protein
MAPPDDEKTSVDEALDALRSQGDEFRRGVKKELAEKRSALDEQLKDPLRRLAKIAKQSPP